MKPSTELPQAGPDASSGARAYRAVLQQAGGSQLQALARRAESTPLCVALYQSPPYDLQVPALPVARLSVTLTAARVIGGLQGDRRCSYDTPRHALFLMPANAEAHWRKEAPSRHLSIYFHPQGLADEGLGHRLDTPLLNTPLAGLQGLVDELAGELEGGALHATEAADSLARLLLVRLARRLAHQEDKRLHPLPAASMARLREYVAAHLGERLLVADLAGAVGLSPHHFAHVFSAQAGMPPHRYVQEMRMAHALELLARSTQPLAEVAAACGFASQQHLTALMKKRLGTTPARYRRETRGA